MSLLSGVDYIYIYIYYIYIYIYIQSTPLNRVTSVRGYFDPIKRRTLLTENIFVLISMCESYSGPAKSGPIKRLTHLNSGPIKRSPLYIYIYNHSSSLFLLEFVFKSDSDVWTAQNMHKLGLID